MTCIVGLIENENVYIGGDSAGVAGMDIVVRKDPKVFKVNKKFVIGCTSSFRMIELLQFSFNPPKIKKGEDVYRYMCTSFVNAMRETFKNGGFLEIEKNAERGGTMLVGYKNRLFRIHGDFQVEENIESFNACGCGGDYAMGAMEILTTNNKLSAKDKITKALEVAVHRSGGVRPPFNILSTEKIEKTGEVK